MLVCDVVEIWKQGRLKGWRRKDSFGAVDQILLYIIFRKIVAQIELESRSDLGIFLIGCCRDYGLESGITLRGKLKYILVDEDMVHDR
jgi:hypothetical protein